MVHDSLRVPPNTSVDLSAYPTWSDTAWAGTKDAGQERVKALARQLREFQEVFYAGGSRRLLVVLQALDTGGKDSTIRDVFGLMNPQGVKVTSFKRPTEKEYAHDYLWRVHPHVPGDGEIAIFNRSHYEDVLVPRVESLVPEEVWMRRYAHIRDFERLLFEEGTTIVKFFIHISKEEQAERLQARVDDPNKRWKFELGDLATRQKWDEYQKAYAVLLGETSTDYAPWYVIPGDRKWYRKLVIGEIMVDLMTAMDLQYPPAEEGLEGLVIR